MTSIAIAGAGLMGRLLAWRLSRQGHAVHVYESSSADQPASAAYTAAGMIAPYSERSVSDEGVFKRGLQSLCLWPALLQELHTDSGIEVAYGVSGSLLLAHPQDQQQWQRLRQQVDLYGWQENSVFNWLNDAEIHALEPDLAPSFKQGLWWPQERHIDNHALLAALLQAAEQAGAVFHFEQTIEEDQTQGWWCHDQRIAADCYLDCRGVGLKQSAASLPRTLRGVRGEVCRLRSRDVRLQRPVRLLHPRYHLYLVPKQIVGDEQHFVLGATEIESEDRSSVSVRSALELLSALYSVCPALAEARIDHFEQNLRPAYLDHCAHIDQPRPELLRINGLFRHGYLQAPALLHELQQQFGLALAMPTLSMEHAA